MVHTDADMVYLHYDLSASFDFSDTGRMAGIYRLNMRNSGHAGAIDPFGSTENVATYARKMVIGSQSELLRSIA